MTEKTYAMREIAFDAAVLIYLENLANERKCTLSDIINELGRQRAMDEFKTVVNVPSIDLGRVPYRPDDIRIRDVPYDGASTNPPVRYDNLTTMDYDMANGCEITHSKDEGIIFVSPSYKPKVKKGVGIR